MNRFYRKYILHKYSDHISAYAKRPVFIISEDLKAAEALVEHLNQHPKLNISKYESSFLKHIGNLSYEQFLGNHASSFAQASKLKGDKLAEHLRKLSIKNTMGNNYGFDLSSRSQPNRLSKAAATSRWGAILCADETTKAGLEFIFDEVRWISILPDASAQLVEDAEKRCLTLNSSEITSKSLQRIYDFLSV